MRRSFVLLLVLVLASLLVLDGCQSRLVDKKETETPTNNGTQNIGNNKAVILFFSNSEYNESMLNEVSQNLQGNGFNIEFKHFYMSSNSFETISKEYIKRIQDAISAGDTDAFVMPSSMEQFMDDTGLTDNLLDIAKMLQKEAPKYYSQLVQYEIIKGTDKQLSYIPIGLVKTPYEIDRQMAVVRGNISEKYNVKINSLSDYEVFLRQAKAEQGITPGFIVDYSAYVSLALQELGYHLIDRVLNTDRVSFFALSNNDKTMENPVPFEDIPGMKEQLSRFNEWIKEGLLYYPQRVQTTDFSKIGSIVVPLRSYKDLIDFRYLYSDNGSKKAFPLNTDLVSATKVKSLYNKLLITKNAKNPDIVMKLVEWIYSDQKNYDVMRYGQINKDYTLENGKIQLMSNGNNVNDQFTLSKAYYNWAGSVYFANDKYERLHVSAPDNYEQAFNALDKSKELLPLEKTYMQSNINLNKELKNIKQKTNGIDELLVKRQQTCLDFLAQYLGRQNFEDFYAQFIQAQDKENMLLIKDYYREIFRKLENN